MTERPNTLFVLGSVGLALALLISIFIAGAMSVERLMFACSILLFSGVVVPGLVRRDSRNRERG